MTIKEERESLDTLICNLAECNFQLGILHVKGDYFDGESIAFLGEASRARIEIKKILDDLYETKHRMEGLDK